VVSEIFLKIKIKKFENKTHKQRIWRDYNIKQ
jgi:hypothetical protein